MKKDFKTYSLIHQCRIANYTNARYGPGRQSQEITQAWSILQDTVYNCKDDHGNGNHGPIVRLPQTSGLKPSVGSQGLE